MPFIFDYIDFRVHYLLIEKASYYFRAYRYCQRVGNKSAILIAFKNIPDGIGSYESYGQNSFNSFFR